ncbi:endonuclease/exonuclease/phosphatase family protein [Streptomyces sp. NPDC059080]|uniref:endonuclease/exonuclease/phosphatase family protein n=1 Tax=Streptomyces sp. NPDC059080 TaxID=3346718 RepID=UPI00367889D4
MPTTPEPLRVGTYNIRDGGAPDGDFERQLALVADLDILGIQEAKDWDRDRERRLRRAARVLGMQPLLTPSASHGCHLLLLIRTPRVQIIEHTPNIAPADFHHAASRTLIEADGHRITVLHTHLDPAGPDKRLAETGWLTEYAESGRRSLLIGGLNTVGPDDPESPSWDAIPQHLHSRHRQALPSGEYGGLDRRAIRALIAAGYADPAAHLGRPPTPTAGYWPGSEEWEHRSDFVLPSRGLAPALTNWTVIDTSAARRSSDHLPGIATLDLHNLVP